MTHNWERAIDEFVRDITAAGFLTKSEVRSRITALLADARREEREEVAKPIHDDSCPTCAMEILEAARCGGEGENTVGV